MSRRDFLSGSDPGVAQTIRRAIVVGTFAGRDHREQVELELDELEELARTLGVRVVERIVLPLREAHPATFLREGAVDTLAARIAQFDDPAIFANDPLTPRQQRNLEQRWEIPVLDRTEVILAIFAKRATTAEGRLQVEMAQLEHLLPRLAGEWTHLERQRGGVGLRGGPGEKQIEVDRRIVNQRLRKLRERLKTVQRQRTTRRAARSAVPLAGCALVGYTNAGKSTLLNKLTNSKVYADNLLFATLDPTSRRLEFASGRRVIVTDTVGFIQSLPTELVEAFASTLEEVNAAHMLAIVVDASHPDAPLQLETVLETLEQMECEQPQLLVASKIDKVDPAALPSIIAALEDVVDRPAIPVSAVTGDGLRALKAAIDALAAKVVPETRANRPVVIEPADADEEAG